MTRPSIYISSNVPVKQAKKLKAIALAHKATVSDTPTGATHVVVRDPPKNPDENPDLDYLRTLEKKGKMALVHWWYYPDSYDTWLPSAEVEVLWSPSLLHFLLRLQLHVIFSSGLNTFLFC